MAEARSEMEEALRDPRPEVHAAVSLALAHTLDELTRVLGHRMTHADRAENAALSAALRDQPSGR